MAKAGHPAKKKKSGKITSKSSHSTNYKICQKCGEENRLNASECSHCGSERFAPDYIRKLERVTNNTFVQVTLPKDKDEKRITLYKWWPGGSASFNINTMEQWERIAEIIATRLLPY